MLDKVRPSVEGGSTVVTHVRPLAGMTTLVDLLHCYTLSLTDFNSPLQDLASPRKGEFGLLCISVEMIACYSMLARRIGSVI